jgi:hypothetical protein
MRFTLFARVVPMLAALPALAQTTTFGLQAGLATPGGDMTNQVSKGSALALGIQVRVPFRGGHAIVPRIDHVTFKGDRYYPNPSYTGSVAEHAEQKLTSFGVDYNWFATRRTGEGFYLATGLGVLQKQDSYSLSAGYTYAAGYDPNATKTRPYVSFGLGGVIARHVDLSLRLQLFPDQQQGSVYYSNGRRSDYYSQSSTLTAGMAFHF